MVVERHQRQPARFEVEKAPWRRRPGITFRSTARRIAGREARPAGRARGLPTRAGGPPARPSCRGPVATPAGGPGLAADEEDGVAVGVVGDRPLSPPSTRDAAGSPAAPPTLPCRYGPGRTYWKSSLSRGVLVACDVESNRQEFRKRKIPILCMNILYMRARNFQVIFPLAKNHINMQRFGFILAPRLTSDAVFAFSPSRESTMLWAQRSKS